MSRISQKVSEQLTEFYLLKYYLGIYIVLNVRSTLEIFSLPQHGMHHVKICAKFYLIKTWQEPKTGIFMPL